MAQIVNQQTLSMYQGESLVLTLALLQISGIAYSLAGCVVGFAVTPVGSTVPVFSDRSTNPGSSITISSPTSGMASLNMPPQSGLVPGVYTAGWWVLANDGVTVSNYGVVTLQVLQSPQGATP
jgi:hypothetical protein